MASDDRETILNLHNDWITANLSVDVAYLERAVASGPDEFVMFNNNESNYYGKTGFIDLWKAIAAAIPTDASPATLDDRDVRVTVVGDVAWVTYLAEFKVDLGPSFGDAAEFNGGSRGTEIWRRLEGEWQCVHIHCSPHVPGNMGGI